MIEAPYRRRARPTRRRPSWTCGGSTGNRGSGREAAGGGGGGESSSGELPLTAAAGLLLVGRRVVRDHNSLLLRPLLRRVLWQFARDRDEELVDVRRRLGGRLHEEDAVVVGVRLGLLGLDLPLRVEVRLVAGDNGIFFMEKMPLSLAYDS